GDVLDGWARHGIRKEADEIAGMTGLEGDADLAVGLEAADAGAVPGARIDDHAWPALGINFGTLRRPHPDQAVVPRTVEGAAVEHQFDVVFEDMRSGLGQM